MARVLAIDYGSRRVGLAVTDPLRIIATPLDTIDRTQLDDFLRQYFGRESVDEIIIGYPTHPDGQPLSYLHRYRFLD